MSLAIEPSRARAIWLNAQKLDQAAPFGSGPQAVKEAVEHLGYVQIDTINVIERCHHHILYSRIPDYKREHLQQAQSADKSVFEYWAHALAYIPTRDFSFFLPAMKQHKAAPGNWLASVDPKDMRRLIKRIRDEGSLSIRDIDDDVLVEKDHAWASRKPSKRALQRAFFSGELTIGARLGMLKTYELTNRHFGWDKPPRPATENQVNTYMLDRALRAQGIISLDSTCYLDARRKPAIHKLIEARVKRKQLVAVHFEGEAKSTHWLAPELLDRDFPSTEGVVHILSPFDPLIIQRKRLKLFFGYEHLFEAYVPPPKRVLGYFALPVLVGDRILAAIDLKAERQKRALIIQKRTDFAQQTPEAQRAIEECLGRFERFQFDNLPAPGSK